MSLRSHLGNKTVPSRHLLLGAESTTDISELVSGSVLQGRREELRGRSVLILTSDPSRSALVLIELDGVARRMVLWPPDSPLSHVAAVIESAEVDAIVCDTGVLPWDVTSVSTVVPCSHEIAPADSPSGPAFETEWILLTSGTTGAPKLVCHTLASLTGAIQTGSTSPANPIIWSTFYDIRRYGGLQIFLRAVLTGTSLVLTSSHESTAAFLARAGRHGVTHISGTPSHWRHALMSPAAHQIHPSYVRLSGEIADQSILNHLTACYPRARVAHAFASTEAGVAFEVTDGLTGFPASLVGQTSPVEIKVDDGSLLIRSQRTATRYLGPQAPTLMRPDGFVDTGDILRLDGDRYYFAGRRDGVINVGGSKVHPEEVEAVINGHPDVRMSLVHTRKNPITGALVVADVVLKPEANGDQVRELRRDILLRCRETLPAYKVPATINFVPALAITESGKLMRRHA